MRKITILDGPNINILHNREVVYQNASLETTKQLCKECATSLGMEVEFLQSNCEGNIVDYIQQIDSDGLIINAAAYSHTSIAIMDALLTLKIPVIEVHITNTMKRENFRHNSFISKAATGIISGFGINSYTIALNAMHKIL